MNEEEKKAITELEEFIKGPCEICKYCEGAYKLNRKNIIQLLNLIVKLQKENEQLRTEVNSLKKDISNMYDEEVIISIISDNFNLSRNEVLKLLGGE